MDLVHGRRVFGVDRSERDDPRQCPNGKQQEPRFHDVAGYCNLRANGIKTSFGHACSQIAPAAGLAPQNIHLHENFGRC